MNSNTIVSSQKSDNINHDKASPAAKNCKRKSNLTTYNPTSYCEGIFNSKDDENNLLKPEDLKAPRYETPTSKCRVFFLELKTWKH